MQSTSKEFIDYSIVIPVYQNEGSLDATFKSIKNNVIDKNTQYSAEVIFIDDGSTDNSFQTLMRLYEAHPELIIIIKLFIAIVNCYSSRNNNYNYSYDSYRIKML